MKIISKYKDYYDHLQGAYGIDDKVVLDRRSAAQPNLLLYTPSEPGKYERMVFFICDRIYYVVIDHTGRCYAGEDYKKYPFTFDGRRKLAYISGQFSVDVSHPKTDVNTILGCPILMSNPYSYGSYDYYDPRHFWFYPKLSPFKLAKELPAFEIYTELYAWIERNKDVSIPDNRSDVEKLESKGFDKRSSFRNVK